MIQIQIYVKDTFFSQNADTFGEHIVKEREREFQRLRMFGTRNTNYSFVRLKQKREIILIRDIEETRAELLQRVWHSRNGRSNAGENVTARDSPNFLSNGFVGFGRATSIRPRRFARFVTPLLDESR